MSEQAKKRSWQIANNDEYTSMKTTLMIEDALLERAAALTGIKEKTALVHAALEALIEKKSRERLAALGGSVPKFKPGRRRQ